MLWVVWKETSDRIFKGKMTPVDEVILSIAKWVSTEREFHNLRLDDITHNWKATIRCDIA